MKIRRTAFIFAAVSLLIMKPIGSARAAHDSSGAECTGCHRVIDPLKESCEHVEKSDTPSRPANGSEMSRWCDNCHAYGSWPEEAPDSRSSHPVFGSATLQTSNAGNGNAIMNAKGTRGDAINSRLRLLLLNNNYDHVEAGIPSGYLTAAADESATVMCISCHLAHSRGFHQLLQRKNTAELLFSGNRNTACCYPQEEIDALDNDSPPGTFGDYRRTLCCKCHIEVNSEQR